MKSNRCIYGPLKIKELRNISVFCILLPLIILIALTGCGTAAKEIQMRSRSERTGVFTEINKATPPVQGFVDVTIKASINTHLEGY